MLQPLDDRIQKFKAGDYVVVTSYDHPTLCSRCGQSPAPVAYDGQVYRVKAVNVPFVCVSNGDDLLSFDLRVTTLLKVRNKNYKNLFHEAKMIREEKNAREAAARRTQLISVLCPHCAQPMIRQVSNEGAPVFYCPDCNLGLTPTKGNNG